jgi:hypothetical protein
MTLVDMAGKVAAVTEEVELNWTLKDHFLL